MRSEELFRVIKPGLAGSSYPGGVSFESVMRPGYYICHRDGQIFVMDARYFIRFQFDPNTGNDRFSGHRFSGKDRFRGQSVQKRPF